MKKPFCPLWMGLLPRALADGTRRRKRTVAGAALLCVPLRLFWRGAASARRGGGESLLNAVRNVHAADGELRHAARRATVKTTFARTSGSDTKTFIIHHHKRHGGALRFLFISAV